jgi:hypothetical protein
VPSNRITEIVAGERAVTAETAILLGEQFGAAVPPIVASAAARAQRGPANWLRVLTGVGDSASKGEIDSVLKVQQKPLSRIVMVCG